MKALIAMSGGVDSSVAALLMVQAGYECAGATMKLFDNEDVGLPRAHSCCSLDDVEDARAVAYSLGMRHYVFNFSDRFKETVIDDFVSCYENGMTPNPCINCNRFLKFTTLFNRMRELGMDLVVTGHYARVIYDEERGRYLLKKAADESKDQSYVLYSLTQEQLAHVKFPLGDYHKSETRRIAEENGFINAAKPDSQDICFVQNGSYADFINQYTGRLPEPGNFVDMNGNVIGRHKGVICYTVGQRKGLGISAAEPLYVVRIDPEKNEVVLGSDGDLFHKSLIADDVNWILDEELTEPVRVSAKIRYKHKEQPATVYPCGRGKIKVVFDEPVRAITKGQAAVLYVSDIVAGGGTIREILD